MNLYVFPALYYGGYGRHVSCVVIADNIEQAKELMVERIALLAAVEKHSVVDSIRAMREWIAGDDRGKIQEYVLDDAPLTVIVETYE